MKWRARCAKANNRGRVRSCSLRRRAGTRSTNEMRRSGRWTESVVTGSWGDPHLPFLSVSLSSFIFASIIFSGAQLAQSSYPSSSSVLHPRESFRFPPPPCLSRSSSRSNVIAAHFHITAADVMDRVFNETAPRPLSSRTVGFIVEITTGCGRIRRERLRGSVLKNKTSRFTAADRY